jgi:hypothetical protein
MKMLLSLTLITLMSLTPVLATYTPASAQAQLPTVPTGAGLTVPVQGLARSAGRITGTFTISQFVPGAENTIAAVGTLVLRTADGRMMVTKTTLPVQLSSEAATGGNSAISIQQATCPVLHLMLGPLDLNLLGLLVHLDQVNLTIDADPAGGLLGSLLCSIANLLGPGGTIADLTGLLGALNTLLGLLGGLGL